MACEVNNKEINSQCAELLVRSTYFVQSKYKYIYTHFITKIEDKVLTIIL